MPKIQVHEKALAHLSRGLYRSPASAIRELVSNAWDANATIVRIDTNYPNFLQLAVEDNGDGFTKTQFKEPPLDWAKALKILAKVHSLQELGDYWRLLWELSAACPLPYLSNTALPRKLIVEEQKRLQKYQFGLRVDGINLKKPVMLKGN